MHNEQIFTPDWVVNMMLDKIGYRPSADIHDKHIIDNSCGDGAFLVEIVDRYIKHGILDRNISKNELKKGLEKYIHGIEIDSNLCRKTVLRLNSVAAKYSITGINNNEFVNYIHSLGRYKNGGFSTFTTKELEKYLNFKWKERKNIFLTNFYDEKFGCIENK